ncbi:MAG: ferredoxin [Streptosporangiales bacterium]|nr:ferredoxin [Streptosporangiales bacterium]
MKVTVDSEKCCAGGNCVMTAPDVFDQRDSDGTVVLLNDSPPAELHDAVREAADVCPSACITVSE